MVHSREYKICLLPVLRIPLCIRFLLLGFEIILTDSILALYPENFLDFLNFLGLHIYKIMPSSNGDSLIFSFPNSVSLVFCLIAQAKTYTTMNRKSKGRRLVLFLILEEKYSLALLNMAVWVFHRFLWSGCRSFLVVLVC